MFVQPKSTKLRFFAKIAKNWRKIINFSVFATGAAALQQVHAFKHYPITKCSSQQRWLCVLD